MPLTVAERELAQKTHDGVVNLQARFTTLEITLERVRGEVEGNDGQNGLKAEVKVLRDVRRRNRWAFTLLWGAVVSISLVLLRWKLWG